MCDTQVLRKDGLTFFAKNSDREPSEPQVVVHLPRVTEDPNPTLETTYLEIPQVPDRHAVLLSKPTWTWGAEMGINEHGLVVGNEAVFTKAHDPTPGLIGLDLLRLALERAPTANAALDVITALLERYGQGGPCGYRDKGFTYDNSFLLADPHEAWILETAGRSWVARRVADTAALSNQLTLTGTYDRQSADLPHPTPDFAATYTARFMTHFSGAKKRMATSRACLHQTVTGATPTLADLIAHLRVHHTASPRTGSNADVCMHAGGYIRRSQTTASMVVRLTPEGSVCCFTGTAAPCLSLFQPISFEAPATSSTLTPPGTPLPDTLWYRHEHLHRHLLLGHPDRDAVLRERDAAEAQILALFADPHQNPGPAAYQKASALARAWQDRWYPRFAATPFRYHPRSRYDRYWKRLNRRDGLTT